MAWYTIWSYVFDRWTKKIESEEEKRNEKCQEKKRVKILIFIRVHRQTVGESLTVYFYGVEIDFFIFAFFFLARQVVLPQ